MICSKRVFPCQASMPHSMTSKVVRVCSEVPRAVVMDSFKTNPAYLDHRVGNESG